MLKQAWGNSADSLFAGFVFRRARPMRKCIAEVRQISLFCIATHARVLRNTKISSKVIDPIRRPLSAKSPLPTFSHNLGVLRSPFTQGSCPRAAFTPLTPPPPRPPSLHKPAFVVRTQRNKGGLLRHILRDFTQLAGFPKFKRLGPTQGVRRQP